MLIGLSIAAKKYQDNKAFGITCDWSEGGTIKRKESGGGTTGCTYVVFSEVTTPFKESVLRSNFD